MMERVTILWKNMKKWYRVMVGDELKYSQNQVVTEVICHIKILGLCS